MPDRPAPRAPHLESSIARWRSLLALLLAALAAGAIVAALLAGGDPQTTATAASPPTGEALVRSVQRRLGVTVDGVFGPQTRGAVTSFQEGRGLPATGELDDETLVALGIIAQEGLSVMTTTVASRAAAGQVVAAQASAPPEEDAETTPSTATAPTTTPSTVTTPASSDDGDEDVAPVAGGALAGAAPPVVGGQIPVDGGLSPTPPRPVKRPGSRSTSRCRAA